MHRFMMVLATLVIAAGLPISTFAWVDYGAYYSTPGPYSQMYYQPMYAYAWAPSLSSSNHYPQQRSSYSAPQYSYPQYNNYPQQQQYNYPQYNQYPQQQYSYPQYNTPQYNYYPQQTHYTQPVPYSYGYPTGDTAPWTGEQLCTFPDYNGRAACGSNPNQWIYDPWTGSWY